MSSDFVFSFEQGVEKNLSLRSETTRIAIPSGGREESFPAFFILCERSIRSRNTSWRVSLRDSLSQIDQYPAANGALEYFVDLRIQFRE